MTKHSKNDTASSIFSYAEYKKLDYVMKHARISRYGDAAIQPEGQVVEWDAWQLEMRTPQGDIQVRPGGWYWDLPQKDVTLAVLSRLPFALRLSFSVVWLGEYCIMVEIISLSPPSGTRSHEPLGPFCTARSTHSISGMVDAGDNAEPEEMAQSGASNEGVALADLVPLASAVLPGPGPGHSGDPVE